MVYSAQRNTAIACGSEIQKTILEILAKRPEEYWYTSVISKETGIPATTVNGVMMKLVSRGVCSRRKEEVSDKKIWTYKIADVSRKYLEEMQR